MAQRQVTGLKLDSADVVTVLGDMSYGEYAGDLELPLSTLVAGAPLMDAPSF